MCLELRVGYTVLNRLKSGHEFASAWVPTSVTCVLLRLIPVKLRHELASAWAPTSVTCVFPRTIQARAGQPPLLLV